MLPALLAPLASPLVKGLIDSVVSPIANSITDLLGDLAKKGVEKTENHIKNIIFDPPNNLDKSKISY